MTRTLDGRLALITGALEHRAGERSMPLPVRP